MEQSVAVPNAVAAETPTYRMFVKDLMLACKIGVYAHERHRRQRVRVNVELLVRDEGAGRGDDVAAVVSYESIVDLVKSLVAEGHINLIETLAERTAEGCLGDEHILVARVRVEKLDVIAESASVGIEIERRRPGSAAGSCQPLRLLDGGGP